MRLPRAEQHQHFRDECGHPRQSHAGEKREPGDRRVYRHLLREATEAVYLAMVRAIVDHADQDKEHRRDGAVIEHLQHRAVDSRRRERRQPEHHVTHVANRRIGNQLLIVSLRHRAHRAIYYVDSADHAEEQPRELVAGGRQHRKVDAQNAVGAHFQQHAGENHGNSGRRFDVRVGQPCMERKRRNLDREADEQSDPCYSLESN